MNNQALAFLTMLLTLSMNGYCQQQPVGGPCEGCEAIHESPVPFDKLTSFVKLPDANWDNKKPLGINGIVYKADRKTPAPNVVLYVYHTNEKGALRGEKRRDWLGTAAWLVARLDACQRER